MHKLRLKRDIKRVYSRYIHLITRCLNYFQDLLAINLLCCCCLTSVNPLASVFTFGFVQVCIVFKPINNKILCSRCEIVLIWIRNVVRKWPSFSRLLFVLLFSHFTHKSRWKQALKIAANARFSHCNQLFHMDN